MFPGYIFLVVSRGWEALASTRGIRHLFMCGDNPTRVNAYEIDALRSREDGDGYIRLDPPVTVGDRVRVNVGVFLGRRGVVQGMTARDRCRVLLSVMERSVHVDVDACALSVQR